MSHYRPEDLDGASIRSNQSMRSNRTIRSNGSVLTMPDMIDEAQVFETTIDGTSISKEEMIKITSKLLSDNDMPTVSTIYIFHINYYDEEEFIDFSRYQVAYSINGVPRITDYAHTIKWDGDVTHSVIQIAKKPRLRIKELFIPIKSVRFDSKLGEFQIKLKVQDIFDKAIQELGALGLPAINSDRQSYKLIFAHYFMDEHIKTSSISWNPYMKVNSEMSNEMTSDEYIEVLSERPDHVRLLDIRLEYTSLFWLQECITKMLDKRLN